MNVNWPRDVLRDERRNNTDDAGKYLSHKLETGFDTVAEGAALHVIDRTS